MPSAAGTPASLPGWDPEKPLKTLGTKLRVQPVLMSVVQEHRDETSYRNWGSVHTEPAAVEEAARIRTELNQLAARPIFPIEFLPLARVSTVDEARRIHQGEFDTVLLFPASGSQELLRACFAPQPARNTLVLRTIAAAPSTTGTRRSRRGS